MSARDVWGFSIIRYFIVGLSCVRAAYVHDVCVWFRRASRRSCQVGARCGHFGWRVLLTAALSCRPLHSFTAPFRSEMSGASALGTCVFSLARASAAVMRHVCVWPACELLRSFRSLHGGRFCVASAADRCAELSPPVKHYCAMSARDVWGFSFGYFVFYWQARASEPLICTTYACGSGVRVGAAL